jgi:two-component system chemotaxis response regulator CheB
MPDTIKVLIVDDSRIFRGALQQALADIPEVAVVGSVWNGIRALEFLKQNSVNLVTLDLEMPQMGGLETLRAIRELNAGRPSQPPVGVLLVSAYTREGAAVTIEGLQAGAFDFITKPSAASAEQNLAYLKEQLEGKVRVFKAQRPGVKDSPFRGPLTRSDHPGVPARAKPHQARAIFIGVSTGGPAALAQLLPELTSAVALPVCIVQHMPAGFTKTLAESLERKCSAAVFEAEDGQLVEDRTVYIAPGGRHMLVRMRSRTSFVLSLNDQPPQNNCRPSADVLLRSAAAAYGADAIGIILTGMGCDGAQGLAALRRAGAFTIAQDEASSVVWGMPGSAVAAGCVDQILPLPQIAAAVRQLVKGPAGPTVRGTGGGGT